MKVSSQELYKLILSYTNSGVETDSEQWRVMKLTRGGDYLGAARELKKVPPSELSKISNSRTGPGNKKIIELSFFQISRGTFP